MVLREPLCLFLLSPLAIGARGSGGDPDSIGTHHSPLLFWCWRRESNPQGTKYRGILSPLRLPVPPLQQVVLSVGDRNSHRNTASWSLVEGAAYDRGSRGRLQTPRPGAGHRPAGFLQRIADAYCNPFWVSFWKHPPLVAELH